jgi:hypothetical protein
MQGGRELEGGSLATPRARKSIIVDFDCSELWAAWRIFANGLKPFSAMPRIYEMDSRRIPTLLKSAMPLFGIAFAVLVNVLWIALLGYAVLHWL